MIDPGEKVEQTTRIFNALAHPSRRQVLLTLHFRGGEMTAGGIAERFGCSWPTTSRHLQVLKESGLVTVEKRGRERIYSLNRAELVEGVSEWLNWFEKSS